MSLAENLSGSNSRGGARGGYAVRVSSAPQASTWDTIQLNRQRDLLVRNVPGIAEAGTELFGLLSAGLDDNQLLHAANDLTGNMGIETLVSQLQSMNDPTARARYGMLHPMQQASLMDYGYQVPQEPEPDDGGGWFGEARRKLSVART